MRRSVLVIAPQAALRAAMERLLMQAGGTVAVASNAKRVHELLEQRTFDAAIVSNLHGAEGSRLTREVQASLPREAALGKFVKHGHCALVVDLTLKDFSNG
jgi:DNA-binding NtrC family response regulator